MTDEQLQREIAERLGWTWTSCAVFIGYHWHDPEEMCRLDREVPNWPTDRNASYELVKDFTHLEDGLYCAGPSSAKDECLSYLAREGGE